MARRVISDQQFAAMATDGASRRMTTGEQGGPGYYVSRDPNIPMSQGGGREVVSGAPSASDVAAHHEESMPAVEATEPRKRRSVYQGVWSETKDVGPTYLDVTDRTPRYSEALTTGAMGSQKAIARVKRSGNVDIVPTGTETPEGKVLPKEGALMQGNLQRKKELQESRRKKMSKSEKNAALKGMDKDVSDIKRALG
jgi:hypothetical protein